MLGPTRLLSLARDWTYARRISTSRPASPRPFSTQLRKFENYGHQHWQLQRDDAGLQCPSVRQLCRLGVDTLPFVEMMEPLLAEQIEIILPSAVVSEVGLPARTQWQLRHRGWFDSSAGGHNVKDNYRLDPPPYQGQASEPSIRRSSAAAFRRPSAMMLSVRLRNLSCGVIQIR